MTGIRLVVHSHWPLHSNGSSSNRNGKLFRLSGFMNTWTFQKASPLLRFRFEPTIFSGNPEKRSKVAAFTVWPLNWDRFSEFENSEPLLPLVRLLARAEDRQEVTDSSGSGSPSAVPIHIRTLNSSELDGFRLVLFRHLFLVGTVEPTTYREDVGGRSLSWRLL